MGTMHRLDAVTNRQLDPNPDFHAKSITYEFGRTWTGWISVTPAAAVLWLRAWLDQ